MTAKRRVLILRGQIGNGKSTFAKQLADMGAIVVDRDKIVELYHNGKYTDYSEDLKFAYQLTERSVLTGALFKNPRPVVIDRCNTKRKTVERYALDAERVQAKWRVLDLGGWSKDNILPSAWRRHYSNSRNVPLDVWIEVAKKNHDLYEEISHWNWNTKELAADWLINGADNGPK